ncbi:MAG: hypothetical protein ACPG19_10350 [Saprospiraceae bacterium]
MLQLIRTNQPIAIIFIIIYATILRSYQFMYPSKWAGSDTNWLGDAIYNSIGSTFWMNTIALLLVIIQAIIINSLVNRYRIARELTYFPALMYVFVASMIPEFLYLSPVLMANTFIIISFSELFKWYKSRQAAANIFNFSFWLAVGSFFYFSIEVYYLLGIIGLFTFRSMKVNEFLILTIGLLVPYFLVGVYHFWIGQLDYYLNHYLFGNTSFFDWSRLSSTPYLYYKIGLFATAAIWIFSQSQRYFFKTNIQIQKNITALFWSILIGSLAFTYQNDASIETFLLTSVPLSIFLALNLLLIKKTWILETIHLIMLILVIGFQYKDAVLSWFFL